METTQAITAVIGAVGGLGGISALVGSVFQRRKIRAEAADVLTDTAITLVEPLQKRVRELEDEAATTRTQVREARSEATALREELGDVLATLRRWRAAMLSTAVTREELRRMASQIEPGRNGLSS